MGCVALAAVGCTREPPDPSERPDDPPEDMATRLVREGREVFRFDTFGDEAFWGGRLQLHRAIAGDAHGGVGPGISPRTALSLGLKVDADALPAATADAIRSGNIDLDDPANTLALLEANSVVGIRGFFDPGGGLTSIGITCALCHSIVDDSLTAGIGRRLDGWPNRDLDVGQIIAAAPDLSAYTELFGIDADQVRAILVAWGPGKFDPQLILDGQGFRPDGKTAAVLIPPAFGMQGINMHTYTGFGSIPYWNAFVARLEMGGLGRFYDPRLNDPERFPIAAKARLWDVQDEVDLITSKLPALHAYQLSLPAPAPPAGSFDPAAAERGQAIFMGQANCASCHTPPLYAEPGFHMHSPEEIGIDAFQAMRSPEQAYRTTPLRGLHAHAKGGFYHDGRFATLRDVVNHYDAHFQLGLDEQQKDELVEFLKSL